MPSDSLKKLAEEIETKFNERPGIYFTPAVSDNKNKVNATGKFVQRINYMRKIFVESGLLVFPNKNVSLNSEEDATGKL